MKGKLKNFTLPNPTSKPVVIKLRDVCKYKLPKKKDASNEERNTVPDTSSVANEKDTPIQDGNSVPDSSVPSNGAHGTNHSVPTFSDNSGQRHCGLFGDPHLRTFSDKRQTCMVAGTWPLLDNQFIGIQVTNKKLPSSATNKVTATNTDVATATTKVRPSSVVTSGWGAPKLFRQV